MATLAAANLEHFPSLSVQSNKNLAKTLQICVSTSHTSVQEEKLKAAFATATAANAELEAQVAALQTEQSKLRADVMNFSLDLTHSKAMRKIFEGQVKDLERVVAEYEETAESRVRNKASVSSTVPFWIRIHAEAFGFRLPVRMCRLGASDAVTDFNRSALFCGHFTQQTFTSQVLSVGVHLPCRLHR